MENLEELETLLTAATATGIRGNLIPRAGAWSSMRQNGIFPDDAPANLAVEIEADLTEYGFNILRATLSCKDRGGSIGLINRGFQIVGQVFEALTTNSSSEFIENGHYKMISGCAYHLAGYSAMAYSILSTRSDENLTPLEASLRLLILRDLDQLRDVLQQYLTSDEVSDEVLSEKLLENEIDDDELIGTILNASGMKAIAYFEFALETGDDTLVIESGRILKSAIKLATEATHINHYWILRLIQHLVDDLWNVSLHVNLPQSPFDDNTKYDQLRQLFLTTLYSRKNAEVELWPSQLEAASRVSDLSDDLVVALPTSAGKTRIAELAALMTLSTEKRVLIVTPLRALSAQTERTIRATFGPLGFRVSSLYGASGSSGDQDALRTNDIIISTPEKLDFALRSDPTIIDDVGLVVLDEGHLIGPKDREIRYEILVQKLLKRTDSTNRRIVCLSAILPEGEPLEDLTAWIRKDKDGTPINIPWRPTRQRFGLLSYQGDSVKLNYGELDRSGFIKRFIEIEPKDDSPKLRSGELKDVTITSAWKFAEDGKRVLIFIPVANWIEGFGKVAVELVNDGFIKPLVKDPKDIERAVGIGEEWLGQDHPVVAALKIGVGLHYAKLPNPFLRELELLLSNGKIGVTIASPTLSQGLNINAAVLLFPYLKRGTEKIEGEEFRNIAGRAGRAFVDVEGLVLHVAHNSIDWRRRNWFELVQSSRARDLQSGFLQVINLIINRLSRNGILKQADAFEYLANNVNAWKGQTPRQVEAGNEPSADYDTDAQLEMLDSMVLGLVEALDTDREDLPSIFDEALKSSLWERQLNKMDVEMMKTHKQILLARANLIWANTNLATRKGIFAMGVGFEAGLKLDQLSQDLGASLDASDTAALAGDLDGLVTAITQLADQIYTVSTFQPKKPSKHWKKWLKQWLSGLSIDTIGLKNMKYIEDNFVYKLVWALEAIRVRRIALGWEAETVQGAAAACLETGTSNYQSALLVRAGLPSRIASLTVVSDTNPNFERRSELGEWLASTEIAKLSETNTWPTAETADLWNTFRDQYFRKEQRPLRINQIAKRSLHPSTRRPSNGIYRLHPDRAGVCHILTPSFETVGRLNMRITQGIPGSMYALFTADHPNPAIRRIGPGKLEWGK